MSDHRRRSGSRAVSAIRLPEATVTAQPRAHRTLRGRVAQVGLATIALWLVLLTTGFGLFMKDRFANQADELLRTRAAAAATTIQVSPRGVVSVRESPADGSIDSGIWIYAGRRPLERATGNRPLQAAVDAMAGKEESFAAAVGENRLFALPVNHGRRHVATVVASISTAPYRHAVDTAVAGSIVLAALVLAGIYPVLRGAAGRALQPVATMTAQAGEWSAHAANERFGNRQRFRELQELATTLDGVLDRISAVVRHEQQLSAELSHELRTPLTRIIAETDLLLSRADTPAETRAANRGIRESALTMSRILETLLTTARAETNSIPGTSRLEAVIEQLQADHRTHRLTPHLQSPDVVLGVDARVVERILWPIVDNARRYARTRIDVRAHRSGADVVVEVIDDGPGMPSKLHDRVFDPGFRGRADDGHPGAGLGLALARRLARAGGGDVTVGESPSGTVIRVRLPSA